MHSKRSLQTPGRVLCTSEKNRACSPEKTCKHPKKTPKRPSLSAEEYNTHTLAHTLCLSHTNTYLPKKRRKSSKRNYYIISARVIIKAISIITHVCKHIHTYIHISISMSFLSSWRCVYMYIHIWCRIYDM